MFGCWENSRSSFADCKTDAFFMFLFKNRMASMVEEARFALCLVIVKPVVEKACSNGTLVPGTDKYFRARLDKRGYLFYFFPPCHKKTHEITGYPGSKKIPRYCLQSTRVRVPGYPFQPYTRTHIYMVQRDI